MLFLQKLFNRKSEPSFTEKKEKFAAELLKIEEKHLPESLGKQLNTIR
jgi:hypothetical protein